MMKNAVVVIQSLVIAVLAFVIIASNRPCKSAHLPTEAVLAVPEAKGASQIREDNPTPSASSQLHDPQMTPKSSGSGTPIAQEVAATEAWTREDQLRLDTLRARQAVASLYGRAFANMDLDPETRAKVAELFTERYRVQMDVGAASKTAGIDDAALVKELAISELESVDAEIRSSLGTELYDQIEFESRIAEEQTRIEMGFGRELGLIGDELGPDQSYALASAMFEIRVEANKGTYSTPSLIEQAQFSAAAAILTEGQLKRFMESSSNRSEIGRLDRRKKALNPSP